MYAYVGNDPLNFMDPTGLAAKGNRTQLAWSNQYTNEYNGELPTDDVQEVTVYGKKNEWSHFSYEVRPNFFQDVGMAQIQAGSSGGSGSFFTPPPPRKPKGTCSPVGVAEVPGDNMIGVPGTLDIPRLYPD